MDVLAELLPPSYLVKSENAAKDKKHKGNKYNSRKHSYTAEAVSLAIEENRTIDSQHWDQVERRSGKDRREGEYCRGRWLESRAEKDRRQLSKAIQITI